MTDPEPRSKGAARRLTGVDEALDITSLKPWQHKLMSGIAGAHPIAVFAPSPPSWWHRYIGRRIARWRLQRDIRLGRVHRVGFLTDDA